MSALRTALADNDRERACDLIWRRLAGDHLDAPYEPALGQSPTDYLRDLHDGGLAAPLAHMLTELLEHRVPGAIAAQPSAAEAGRIIELLSLLQAVSYEDRSGQLGRLCGRLMLLPPTPSFMGAMQIAAFKTYVALGLEDEGRLVTLFSPALYDPALLPGYCIEAAKANPELFLRPISRHLFPELARGTGIAGCDLDFLSEAIRIAANELHDYYGDDARLAAIFHDHFADISQCARTARGPVIRSAVLKGLSRSSLPASFLRQFEAAYWDAYPQPNATLSRAGELPLRNWLRGQLTAPKLDHSVGLGLNSVPYGEAGLFRLLSIALRVGWDFRLNIDHDDYSKIGGSLSEKSLSLAVHNNSLLRQLKLEAGHPRVLASPPVLTFRNYDVLASQVALCESLGDSALGDDARALAMHLLEGGRLELAGEAPGHSAAMVELIEQRGVYFLKNTDTQEVAFLAIGAESAKLDDDEPYIVSTINPDEGLEQLLDGKVAFYFGGAIQGNYALNNCANRILAAGQVKMATNLQFYVAENAYANAERRQTYDFILQAWNVTKELWRMLRYEHLTPRELPEARHALREEIMIEVNRAQDMPNGFVSSFDDLFDLIHDHDTIHDMPDDAGFEAVQGSTGNVLLFPPKGQQSL